MFEGKKNPVSADCRAVIVQQGSKQSLAYLIFICSVATLAGFLFGFDASVINGTVAALSKEFHSTGVGTGLSVSSVLIGSAVGSLLAGQFADGFGRKQLMLMTAILFALGAWGAGAAHSAGGFFVYRLIGGFGVGAASVVAPAYIAEVSPPELRGRLTTIQQLAIVVGLQCAFVSNYLIAHAAGSAGAPWLLGLSAWRWMFWVQLIPSALYFACSLTLPESPRYLIAKGRDSEALLLIRRLWGTRESPDKTLAAIRRTVSVSEGAGGPSLFVPGRWSFIPLVWVGLALAFFQQASGINAVMYFGEYLWAAAGFTEQSGLLINVALGAVLVVSTLVSMVLVDRVGRRPLLLAGSAVMTVTLLTLTAVFVMSAHGPGGTLHLTAAEAKVILVAEHAFIFAFGVSWGPVVWVLLGEMFPNRIRAHGLAVSAGGQWVTAFAVTMTFPPLLSTLGLGGVFFIYSVATLFSYITVYKFVRETNGVHLEDMPEALPDRSGA
jgi:SP family sugar:H+ symporter-like MFS transporter